MKKIKRVLCLFVSLSLAVVSLQIEPEKIQAAEYWPEGIAVESQAAIVMEASTGTILYEKNMDEQHYPASITKLMTALVALKYGNLEDIVTFSSDSVYGTEGSSIARDVGEQMTLEQTMYGMLLESANECAYAIAEHVGGTVDNFVAMMNEEAAALGCTNTHFANPHGLQDETHYTSAHDMALIAREVWKYETFRIMTGTRRYVIPPTNKHSEETYLQNHNEMINAYKTAKYLYEYCVGGKTGYTETANSTLVTYAQKDGMTFICVIMNAASPAQWTDSENLYNYCFDNFKLYNVEDNETRFSNDTLNAGALNTNSAFVDLDQDAEIVLPVTASFEEAVGEVSARDDSQDIAGTINYTYAGHAVGSADILKNDTQVDKSFEFKNVIADEVSTEDGGVTQKVFQVTPERIAMILLIIGIIILLILLLRKFISNFYLIRQRYYNWRNSRSPYKPIKKKKFKKKGRKRRR